MKELLTDLVVVGALLAFMLYGVSLILLEHVGVYP